MDETRQPYEVVPFPAIREASLDVLRMAHGKHMIHAFSEVDVTTARQLIRDHRARTGERLSFTAFIVACLARAVAENRSVNAYRLGRRRIVRFHDVDVNTMVEREVDGETMGTPNIIRAADKKTVRQIHDEIRAAQAGKVEQARGMEWFKWAPRFARLPTFLRMFLWRVLARSPHVTKNLAGTAGVTAVGMFGSRTGWGMTIPFLTVNVVLGGISTKPVLVDGRLEPREHLCVTVSVDHDIVDGAPAARLVNRFAELIEGGFGLEDGLAPNAQMSDQQSS
jgi:pyruvate/2-oxoglutarate dehydrogenase complex dihydrolipoamide acyltransferase (E2) component